MGNTESLPEVDRIVENNQWEHPNCRKDANYTCLEHHCLILCEGWKEEEHYDWDLIEYHSPKNLSNLMIQVAAMVKHIIHDCNMFKNSATVTKIRNQISVFQK